MKNIGICLEVVTGKMMSNTGKVNRFSLIFNMKANSFIYL